MTGNETDWVTDARATLGRRFPQRTIFGVREFFVGDIFSPQIPLVSQGQAGAGFVVSSFPLFQQSEFDRTSLRGELPQNWEVELYRNEVLLASQESRGDGRYEFTDVPLVFGFNVLRLVFYGPQAQKREKIQTIVVGQGVAGQGKHYVRVASNLDATDLYDFIDEKQEVEEDIGSLARFSGEYLMGVNERVSLSTGFSSYPVNEVRRQYGMIGVSGSLFNTFSRLNLAQDFRGGSAVQFATQTRIHGANVFVEHNHFFDFLSERSLSRNRPLASDSTVRLDGIVPSLWHFPQLPLTLNANFENTQSGEKALDVSNRLSVFAFGLSASHSLDWFFDLRTDPNAVDRGRGSFLLNGRLARLLLRGQFNYDIEPRTEASSLMLTGDYRLRRGFSFRGGINHQLNPDDRTTYSGGFNFQNRYFGMGVSGQIDSEGIYSVTTSLTFSLGWNSVKQRPTLRSDRLATTGTALARVYLDHNQNGQYDARDEPISGVTFSPGGQYVQTDEQGMAYLSGLSPYLPTPVAVQEKSLENPYWSLTQEGYNVVSRPGTPTILNFPVVMTGEVDGMVYLVKDAASKAVSNVRIQLVDADGEVVQEVKSAYDGFYLFLRVLPGVYDLRVSPQQAQRLGLEYPEVVNIVIQSEDNIMSGIDILLTKTP